MSDLDLDVAADLAGATTKRALKKQNPADRRQGTVQQFDAVAGVALVLLDGDAVATPLPVISVVPLAPGTRVNCLVTDPHGGVVLGQGNGTPVYTNFATTGLTGSIGTVDQVLAGPILGPRLPDGTAVVVTYTCIFDLAGNGIANSIILARAEVSLDGGTSWIAGPTFGVTVGTDNGRMPHHVGVGVSGSTGQVQGRVIARSGNVAGATPVSYFHELRTGPRP